MLKIHKQFLFFNNRTLISGGRVSQVYPESLAPKISLGSHQKYSKNKQSIENQKESRKTPRVGGESAD